MPPSPSACWISAYFSVTRNQVGVYLRLSKKEIGDSYYQALLSEKDTIEKDLGFKVTWQERDSVYSISVHRKFASVHSDEFRAAIKEFFAFHINQFVNVFRPRMERMAEDDQ